MTRAYWIVSLAYLAFAAGVYLIEARRTRGTGIDAISLFLVILMLQCCLSPALLYGLLPFADPIEPTGVYAFDRILRTADIPTALLILCLTIAFTMFFYVGCILGRTVLRRLWPVCPDRIGALTVSEGRIAIVLGAGLMLTLYSFWLLGDTMASRYIELVLFRAEDPSIERNALNANAFALTQSWSWLSIIGVFCIAESRKWRALLLVFIAAALVFALLGASRRALFLPILMVYLTIALYSNKWHSRWIAVAAVPLIVWVAFGKNMLAALAYDVSAEQVAETYQSWVGAFVRAASDIGISVVESLGSLHFLDLPPRLGLDHLMAMVDLLPEKSMGIDFDFPERIVRISTEAFDGAAELDVPPGLLGQMWLDFRLAGPLVWGMVFGLQISLIQFFFERTRCTRQSAAIFVLLVFVVALPVNTGSFDFTFSVDIVAIGLGLVSCIGFGSYRLAPAQSIATAGGQQPL